jgi:ATP-binding protein involved in chromosome partitioning
LTMAQKIPLSGAVIVTTPQDIALADVYKAYKMFEKLEIPVLGVVENMSYHTCSGCGHEEYLFGTGGGEKLVKEFNLDLLAQIPLSRSLREKEDKGEPVVTPSALTEDGQRFVTCAEKVAMKLASQEVDMRVPIQKITVTA